MLKKNSNFGNKYLLQQTEKKNLKYKLFIKTNVFFLASGIAVISNLRSSFSYDIPDLDYV